MTDELDDPIEELPKAEDDVKVPPEGGATPRPDEEEEDD